MTKEIPLTKGFVALVDDDTHECLSRWRWRAQLATATNMPYAIRVPKSASENTRFVSMHRFILQAPQGMWVDHINGNTLDNRKSNLRLATPSQNACNRRSARGSTSSFLGVTWHKQLDKWQAQIGCGGRTYYLGLFDNEVDAARAYDDKARELFGEFARLNLSSE